MLSTLMVPIISKKVCYQQRKADITSLALISCGTDTKLEFRYQIFPFESAPFEIGACHCISTQSMGALMAFSLNKVRMEAAGSAFWELLLDATYTRHHQHFFKLSRFGKTVYHCYSLSAFHYLPILVSLSSLKVPLKPSCLLWFPSTS